MKIAEFKGGSFAKNNGQSDADTKKFRFRYIGEDDRNLSAVGLIKTGDEFTLNEKLARSLMHNAPELYEQIEEKVEEVKAETPVKPETPVKQETDSKPVDPKPVSETKAPAQTGKSKSEQK